MPTSTYYKVNAFVEAVAEKKHDFQNDEFMVALMAAANPPDAADAVLTDLTQISYTYCSTRVITKVSSGQTAGAYNFVVQDLTLTAAGGAVGPFRYVAVYNNTATNKDLVGYFDYGSEITLQDTETLLLDFNAAGLFGLT